MRCGQFLLGQQLVDILLGTADIQLMLDNIAGSGKPRLLVGNAQQRTGMALGQLGLADQLHILGRKLEQAQLIGNRALGLADTARGLLLGQPI